MTSPISAEQWELILPLISNSLLAALILGLLSGAIGVFVMMRELAFAVHSIAELSFAGAALALLLGWDVITGSILGSVIAALLLAFLAPRSASSSSFIGVLMPFGLGLGILFLSLYEGRASNKFSLLTGQIVAVDSVALETMALTALVVMISLLVIWRPLRFASVDPVWAASRGVPVQGLSVFFMIVLGISVALCIQVVGALLVLALLITPAAAAMKLSANPSVVVALSTIFATFSAVGGVLLSVLGTIPVSPYVTTLSFACYVAAVLISRVRNRKPGSLGTPQ